MNYASFLSEDRFVIFLFHGVIEKQTHPLRNYTRKHLERDYFRQALLSLLDAGGQAISMDEVLTAHEEKRPLPSCSFAITFDDGFRNNLTVAAPVLDDLNIPATFYVTSDFIASNRMSWIDRIEWAVEQSGPATLSLPWGDENLGDLESRRAALDSVRTHLKRDRHLSMDGVATSIQVQLGFPETWASDDPLDQKMTWSEVQQIASHPLFSVGGHSHSHPILSFLAPKDLTYEIETSLSLLADHGIGPCHYSYPEGLAHCYTPAVIDQLKTHGVRICPSAIEGDNDRDTDLFHLRRVMAI